MDNPDEETPFTVRGVSLGLAFLVYAIPYSLFPRKPDRIKCHYMTGYAGSRDYLGTPQSPRSSVRVICSFLLLQIVRNPHRILARGSESVFQWDVWIDLGSSAGSLYVIRRPSVPRHVYFI